MCIVLGLICSAAVTAISRFDERWVSIQMQRTIKSLTESHTVLPVGQQKVPANASLVSKTTLLHPTPFHPPSQTTCVSSCIRQRGLLMKNPCAPASPATRWHYVLPS